ncbi:MAG: SIR2 family NAD-dependent protein deacylase [Paludibacteraceae bacterium]
MKQIVVLSGAGMSAESGVATFRGSDGIWGKYRLEEVATLEGFEKNPELVLEFYNTRRKQLFQVSPNDGHKLLAALEHQFDVQIITQNVDNLHERSGSKKVLHLHGELMKVRSVDKEGEIIELSESNPEIHVGDTCSKGYQLRPHIVWFGESVPEIDKAIQLVKKADVFIVIGTSLQVYPAAGLLNFVRKGVPIYMIDPNDVETDMDLYNIIHIKKGVSEGMKELIGILFK